MRVETDVFVFVCDAEGSLARHHEAKLREISARTEHVSLSPLDGACSVKRVIG